MLYIEPNYYGSFKCIASACKHSCCVGWEIDIDPDSYERYLSLSGEIGERLRAGIAVKDSQPCFVTGDDSRCPMLNSSGLCDLITACGEESLCDICADHPRFRNYFSDREEIGLGLCCEAAAELIINYPEPFDLLCFDDGEECDSLSADEETLINQRNTAFDMILGSDESFGRKCEALLLYFNVTPADKSAREWASFYCTLEKLDPQWDEYLSFLGECGSLKTSINSEKKAENLLCYFIYRHLPSALDDGDIGSKIAFAVHACRVIFTLAQKYPIEDAARMYSAEIEYSDENINEILSVLFD